MSRKSVKDFRSWQQIKDKQVNYLLGDVEKNLEEYKNALELRKSSYQTPKKYSFLPSKATIK